MVFVAFNVSEMNFVILLGTYERPRKDSLITFGDHSSQVIRITIKNYHATTRLNLIPTILLL